MIKKTNDSKAGGFAAGLLLVALASVPFLAGYLSCWLVMPTAFLVLWLITYLDSCDLWDDIPLTLFQEPDQNKKESK